MNLDASGIDRRALYITTRDYKKTLKTVLLFQLQNSNGNKDLLNNFCGLLFLCIILKGIFQQTTNNSRDKIINRKNQQCY